MPKSIAGSALLLKSGGFRLRLFGAAVQQHRERLLQDCHAGAGLDRLGRKMAAEAACAGHAAEKAEEMARDVVEPRALGKFALDIRHERFDRFVSARGRRALTEEARVGIEQD
jgi:hypothetical protein